MNPLRWLLRSLLVDSPPPAPGPDDLVLLAEADGEGVAGLWQGMLEQRGVHCLIKNISPLAHLRMQDMLEIYVRYEDLPFAREVLGLDGGEPKA